MLRVRPGRAPKVLTDPALDGLLETKAVIAFFRVVKNRTKSYDEKFLAYKHPSVVAALGRVFHNKCAYCETRYGPGYAPDVEHYRPKGAILEGGTLIRPGYYWLAASWTNLLPSCMFCNRSRKHETGGGRRTSGKGNRFPVSGTRMRRPGLTGRERPLLLHPYFDHPDKHLQFVDDGMVVARANSAKGYASIDVLGLDRAELVESRRDQLVLLQHAVIACAEAIEDHIRLPTDRVLKARVGSRVRALKAFMSPEQPYAGMSAQFVAAFLTSPDVAKWIPAEERI